MRIANILRHTSLAGIFSAFLLSACQSMTEPAPALIAAGAPLAGAKGYRDRAPLLQIGATTAPQNPASGKGKPYQVAVTIRVDKNLQDLGRWTELGDGWSSLALRLVSDGAKSISLHLHPAVLPANAELWLCSADGSLRQGPLRDLGGSGLYTPVVTGSEVWIEALAPSAQKSLLNVRIVEAFGGFR